MIPQPPGNLSLRLSPQKRWRHVAEAAGGGRMRTTSGLRPPVPRIRIGGGRIRIPDSDRTASSQAEPSTPHAHHPPQRGEEARKEGQAEARGWRQDGRGGGRGRRRGGRSGRTRQNGRAWRAGALGRYHRGGLNAGEGVLVRSLDRIFTKQRLEGGGGPQRKGGAGNSGSIEHAGIFDS